MIYQLLFCKLVIYLIYKYVQWDWKQKRQLELDQERIDNPNKDYKQEIINMIRAKYG